MKRKQVSILGIPLLLLACGDETIVAPPNPGNLSNERISITNEDLDLEGRVTYRDAAVPILSDSGAPGLMPLADPGFELTLVAEVLPPSIDGRLLQATSVEIQGNFVIVGYNMRGGEYLGGIDVFNITNKKKPTLESEALFQGTDVNAVFYHNGNVFVAEATNDSSFPFPSVCEVMALQGHHLILDGNQRAPLTSYAGTGIYAEGNHVFTTSGDGGHLTVLDRPTLNPVSAIPLHDARWVRVGEGKIVVAQGTPGQLSVFNESDRSPAGTFPFAGADVPESKTTVELAGGKAFVAAGPAGVQVLSLTTGTVLGSVPRPDPASLGLDPAVVVTNAVALDDDLLFISNGEAGVYVARGSQDFDATGSEDQQQITLLGQLQFDALQSVNHVAYKQNYLIIAAGLGGLKIVKLTL